jgi:hypothetical protein
MKFFLTRFAKSLFIKLQLHRIFQPFTGFLSVLVYMTHLSKWANINGKIASNDFWSKWDYDKRYTMYKSIVEKEELSGPINYLEFGVASGKSFDWFMSQNSHSDSRFYGFDTFDGLPEDWGPFKKGTFSTNNEIPLIKDFRGKFLKGLFQQTVPSFLSELDNSRKNVLMMDADLWSSTLFVLTSFARFLKKGDIIFFDEFVVPTHEFKAFLDFTQSYYINLELLAAANNYYFAAFKVI